MTFTMAEDNILKHFAFREKVLFQMNFVEYDKYVKDLICLDIYVNMVL